MSCCYSNIAIALYDEKAMNHPFQPLIWKRSHSDVVPLWIHSDEYANNYLEYLNTTDASGKLDLQCKLKMKMTFNFQYCDLN